MKKYLSLLTIISISLIFFILFHSLFIRNAHIIKELSVKVEVDSVIGVDVDNTALAFGKLPPGSSSTKEIIIENNKEKEVKIILKAEGPSASIIQFSENNIIMESKETKTIQIIATAPLEAKEKYYAGTIKIYSMNP